ncbi:MAG: dynamin family protein, partial [Oscillospiraceae bacterium]|nr:dynamin family protein [Oscillospiraceae bacterium]
MEQALNYGSYSAYKRTVSELTESLIQLKEYSEDIGLVHTAKSIGETVEKVANDHFEVAIVGEFKRGKSTLINALLGQEVLPADVLPATATLNRVTYSETPYVMVEYKNGGTERVDINKLADYVTKLSYESELKAETVKQATVYYDTSFCKNNVDIIDTPGLNDDEQMTNVTLSILPEIDAAVFVISANSPFSQFEKEFLEKKMLSSDMGRIIFAVNCFGTFSKEDEDRIVETVEKRIGSYVMEKAKAVMGEDSKEFAVYKRKIGKPKVIGVYAKKALMAKESGNAAMLEESNFPTFEKVLETMLTQERGVITLQILANKIISSGSELINSIIIRENSLMMETDEFMDKYTAAIEEIDDIRTKKRAEFVRINDAANKVFQGLQPILDSYWVQIEETAMKVIDAYPMSAEDLKKDKLKIVYSKLTERIKENIENKAQLICEQIQNEINIALSDEAERLQSFEDEFFASVTRIQEMFSVPQKRARNGGVVDQIIGVSIGTVGAGGLFIGLREAGIKGALLGGAAGFAGFYATFYAAFSLATVLGIAAGPVVLCIAAVAGLAGTFTGKFSVDKLLVQERIDKYKASFKQSVKKQFHEMKIHSDFSETVRKQVFASFQGLKSKIEEETEIILL